MSFNRQKMKPDDVLPICRALPSQHVPSQDILAVCKVSLLLSSTHCSWHTNAITVDVRLEVASPFYNFLCSKRGLRGDMKLEIGNLLSCLHIFSLLDLVRK